MRISKADMARAQGIIERPENEGPTQALVVTIGKIRDRIFGDAELVQLLHEATLQAGSIHGFPTLSPETLLSKAPSPQSLADGIQRMTEQFRHEGYVEGFEAGQNQALLEYGLEALAHSGNET